MGCDQSCLRNHYCCPGLTSLPPCVGSLTFFLFKDRPTSSDLAFYKSSMLSFWPGHFSQECVLPLHQVQIFCLISWVWLQTAYFLNHFFGIFLLDLGSKMPHQFWLCLIRPTFFIVASTWDSMFLMISKHCLTEMPFLFIHEFFFALSTCTSME